jgi:hypothetical protein
MATDDRRASAGGLGCGGEVGATGRFVSWLRAEIQPPKKGGRMINMVERCEKNKVMFGDVRCWRVRCVCLLPPSSFLPLALSSAVIKKMADFIYRRIGPSNRNTIRLFEKNNMFELFELFDCC